MLADRSRIVKEAGTFLRFGMSGLPGFLLAIALNILLIEKGHWAKPVAYLLVVWVQMTAGFFMCYYFVFTSDQKRSLWIAYGHFALSMGVIRIADWCLYTTLVEAAGVKYVYAQIASTGIFILIKFVRAKSIFKPRSS